MSESKGTKQKNKGGKNRCWLFKPPGGHFGCSGRGCLQPGDGGTTTQHAVTQRRAAQTEIRIYEKVKTSNMPRDKSA